MSGRSRALVLFVGLTGCAGGDVDLNPFYVGRVNETERGKESRVISAGPLWDDAHTPDRRETAFHPFWRRVITPHEGRVQVLHPIVESRWTNDEINTRFLAFSFARSHRFSSTEGDYDFVLFPLFWFGSGPTEDERYFALFPLFGKIKSFAMFAEAGFFLFPLYYYVTKNVTSLETFHNITPFIGWIDGGPRDGSWRVLPIAGHWHYEGKYDKWSVVWPFFWWFRNRLDTDDPSTGFTIWPLIGLEKSERLRFLTFLWPFFRFRTERVPRIDEQGRPFEDVYYHQDVLWPLFRRQRTRTFERTRLFPFYSRYRSEELDSDAFMIPLFWKRQNRMSDWTEDSFYFVPFVLWKERRWNATADQPARPDDEVFKLWPIVRVGHEAGATDVKVPALLPLDVERYTADFEANWGPLFELWHSRVEPDGSTRGNALFRFVDWESRRNRRRFSIPLLYSADHDDRRSRHSLLLGLVRFGGGVGGVELKILGMPILTPEVSGR